VEIHRKTMTARLIPTASPDCRREVRLAGKAPCASMR
jgi:hypothetical protein